MSARMTLFFEPLDVLQFRDYRPFDAGYNVLGQSVFPLPGVFLGCVRGALFRALGANFRSPDDHFGVTEEWAKTLLGSRHEAGTLQLHGPLVARREGNEIHPYFPVPADLVAVKHGDDTRYTVLGSRPGTTEDAPRFYHRRPGRAHVEHTPAVALPWTSRELAKSRGDALFLTEQGARHYLDIGLPNSDSCFEIEPGHAVKQDALLVTENRFGVTRNPDTLTVEPQRFYLQRPYRLARDHGFAVEVMRPGHGDAAAAIGELDGRIVQLGGRGHRARVTVIHKALVPAALRPGQGTTSKLWFVTPAPLQPGLDSWPAGMRVVTERVQAIGGFDQAHRRPRPLLRALPAGTVVHIDNKTIEAVQADLCGFVPDASADASPDSGLASELKRLRHAGFAMALSTGAEKGAS